jgi:hypothetical protein
MTDETESRNEPGARETVLDVKASSEFRNHENAVSRTRIRRFATIRAYR